MDRVGDRPRRHVLVECELLLHDGVRIGQCIVALRHADLAEILPLRSELVHVVPGDQRERGVGAAGAVGIDRILREARERRQRLAERIHVIGVGGDAGDDVGVAGLHRARRTPQRDDACRTAERHVVEPARREAEMLGQPDRLVRREREAREHEPVDVRGTQARLFGERMQRPPHPPVCGVHGVAPIGNGHRRADDHAVIGFACAGQRSHFSAHMNSWILPNAASQLMMSTRLSLMRSSPSIIVSVWVAQAA